MAGENFGLSGLAQSGQYDAKINDLRNQDEYERRVKAEAIARAKMQADESSYQHATNPLDDGILKNDAKKLFSEIGRIRQENPDWEWNPDTRVLIKDKVDSLKTHPALLRSLQYAQAYKEYQTDLAEAQKNPQQWDMELMNQQGKQFDDYLRTDPNDLINGKVKAPLYTRPGAIVDLATILPKMGNSVKDYDIVPTKNGGWYTQAKPGQIDALKDAAYAQNMRSIQVMAKRLNLTTPEQVDQWLTRNIEAGFDKSHNLGDPYALRKLQIQEAHLANDNARTKIAQDKQAAKGTGDNYITWDDLMNPRRKSAVISPKVFNDVWGTTPKREFAGINGKKADLTGEKFFSDGFIVKPEDGKFKGIPHATGYFKMPIKVAEDKGLVKSTNWFGEASEPKEWEVGDGFNKDNRITIVREVDKDGKSQLFAKVLDEIPLDPTDQSARNMYQAATSTPVKMRSGPKNVFGNTPPAGAMVDDAGNVFDAGGQFLGPASDFE